MSYGYTLLSESFPVARKQHRCIWCGESILPGEKYRDERSIFDGEFQYHKWHPECCDAAAKDEEMAEWGGEFSAYDNERPTAGVALPGGGQP